MPDSQIEGMADVVKACVAMRAVPPACYHAVLPVRCKHVTRNQQCQQDGLIARPRHNGLMGVSCKSNSVHVCLVVAARLGVAWLNSFALRGSKAWLNWQQGFASRGGKAWRCLVKQLCPSWQQGLAELAGGADRNAKWPRWFKL
jgi:hypothetical protein